MTIEFLQIVALELHAKFRVEYSIGDFIVTIWIEQRKFGQKSSTCRARANSLNEAVYYCLSELEHSGVVIVPEHAWQLLKSLYDKKDKPREQNK